MVTVTTYKIYLAGSLTAPEWSGDIDSITHAITVVPSGSAIIDINLAGLVDADAEPVTFGDAPITFPDGQPAFVSWTVLSPTELLITDVNAALGAVPFTLFAGLVSTMDMAGIDPTIVNTYEPPAVPLPATSQVRPPKPVLVAAN